MKQNFIALRNSVVLIFLIPARKLFGYSIVFLLLVFSTLAASAAPTECGVATTVRGRDGTALVARKFPDGSIAVRAPLAVNPDGGVRSYTKGDHGFTYIANGISRWDGKARKKCDGSCRADFIDAETAEFAVGSKEFCVFAMEVEPLLTGQTMSKCDRGYIIGNGKGRLKLSPKKITTVVGDAVQAYLSTTSLTHTVQGNKSYLDSEALPLAVTNDVELLGYIVWVGGKTIKYPQLAMIGDKGPAFGEGSIALHQLLRTNEIKNQDVGPIPAEKRCSFVESMLALPFLSRPDLGSKDLCRPGFTPKSPADIRAYGGISESLDFVILGNTDMRKSPTSIDSEVTVSALKERVKNAGHTEKKIETMRQCLYKK
jgi:hypothetical protein